MSTWFWIPTRFSSGEWDLQYCRDYRQWFAYRRSPKPMTLGPFNTFGDGKKGIEDFENAESSKATSAQ